MPRYTVSRAKLGSPIVRDDQGNRAVLVLLRDTDMPPDAADVAAMRMAQVCASALNRVHSEIAWAKQHKDAPRG